MLGNGYMYVFMGIFAMGNFIDSRKPLSIISRRMSTRKQSSTYSRVIHVRE